MTTPPLPGIEHVVLLMLENRSFDNLLGNFGVTRDPPLSQSQFNGLTGNESNPDVFGHAVPVYHATPPQAARKIPPNHPGEAFNEMTEQIYGYHVGGLLPRPASGTPQMDGFVINYEHRGGKGQEVMQYYTPQDVPVTTALAELFAVSDTWYGSAPCETYPNRVFSLCGLPAEPSPDGRVWVDDAEYFVGLDKLDITDGYGRVGALSILELLDLQYPGTSPNWKIYFHDTALSSIVTYVNDWWNARDPAAGTTSNVAYYDGSDYGPLPDGYATFAADVAGGTLPMFSIIEPRYYANWTPSRLSPNSNHPDDRCSPLFNPKVPHHCEAHGPIDVADGEVLLADVVETLYSNRVLAEKTLLVITYDEHGGLYDHQPPPTDAPSPFPGMKVHPFDFTRFGPRVPAIFVNPSIAAGTVFRPQDPGSSYTVFDHTSLIKTLREQFGLTTGRGGTSISQLTDRDGQMPDLSGLITLSTPRTTAELFQPGSLRGADAALAR